MLAGFVLEYQVVVSTAIEWGIEVYEVDALGSNVFPKNLEVVTVKENIGVHASKLCRHFWLPTRAGRVGRI